MAEKDTQDVYSYITTEENRYKTVPVPIEDGWEFQMYEHIRKSFLYKNSKFSKGNNDGKRPFKNIVRPILNVAYRTEGFDVKDIEPFVDNADNYFKSFLVRRYHNKWARDNSIDTFIDELVESYVDYGLALVKNVNKKRPEVVPLKRLAFCDQTDILSGAICEKHYYTPDQMQKMKGKWDDDAIKMAVQRAKAGKTVGANENTAKTPSKYIEVYELHGQLPSMWLNKGAEQRYTDEAEYKQQMQIITYYKSDDNKQVGLTLYSGVEENIYKAIKRDDIFGRACGMGGVEELFDPQTWVNYSEIQMKEMLDAAALMLLQTSDESLKGKNVFTDLEKGEVLLHKDGQSLSQVSITPQNKVMFDNAVIRWEQTARTIGSASDPQLGLNPSSGTPLGTTQIVTAQGVGIHDYRRGKIATFVGEIYRDWVLSYLVSDMNQGQKFLDELSTDELQEVAEKVSIKAANRQVRENLISGHATYADEYGAIRSQIKEDFMRGGSKRFVDIMKGELKSLPVDVYMNVAGKQRNLSEMVDKLSNVFRTIIANPAIMQIPGVAKTFNELIEYSGLSPIDFSAVTKALPQMGAPVEMTNAQAGGAESLPVAA